MEGKKCQAVENGSCRSMFMPRLASISLRSKSLLDAKKTLMIVLYYFRKQRSGHVNKLNRYWIGTSYQVVYEWIQEAIAKGMTDVHEIQRFARQKEISLYGA